MLGFILSIVTQVLVSLKAKHLNGLAAKHTLPAYRSYFSSVVPLLRHTSQDSRRPSPDRHCCAFSRVSRWGTTASAIGAVIRRLGHSAAAAITEAEPEAFEKDTIKKSFGGKVGGRVRRQELTSATVGDGKMLRQLEAAVQDKDDEKGYAVSRAGGVPGGAPRDKAGASGSCC